ncbi:MAG: AMP-binding protein [bacterium]
MGFRWHPAARVFDGKGDVVTPVAVGPAVISERPSGWGLAQAIAAGSFRIGGDGDAPRPGEFETLTSGSSGAPRRIRRNPQSWLRSFAVNAGLYGIGSGISVAVLGRLTQSLALYGAVEAVHLGAELHLLDDLRPDRQRRELASREVQTLYASPAQMRLLVEAGGARLALRHLLIGGSKLDPGLRMAIAEMAPGVGLHEFYGAAEASFVTLADADCPAESVGRPYPGVELRVVAGEIWVKSPYLFEGYAGPVPGGARWDDGWLSVGEMGEMRGGHLYLAGRAGRMVTVADQNVFPEEIEQFLLGLPGVKQAAVVPRRDGLRGQHLVAVLQGDTGREAEILAALRRSLGALKAPKALLWQDDWPVLASGKTDLLAIASRVAG